MNNNYCCLTLFNVPLCFVCVLCLTQCYVDRILHSLLINNDHIIFTQEADMSYLVMKLKRTIRRSGYDMNLSKISMGHTVRLDLQRGCIKNV